MKGLAKGRGWASVMAATVMLAVMSAWAVPARADVVTTSIDNLRTGWDSNEPNLSPSAVADPLFGKMFTTLLDGSVYAQPIVADKVLTDGGDEVLAVTEKDKVYGINARSGAIVWSRDVGPSLPPPLHCGDLVPDVGITSTPVYDPTTKTAYFMAKRNVASHPQWYMYGIDVRTGFDVPGFPRMISGSPTNGPTTSFNATTAMQRTGLLLLDGVVYAGFASLCDQGPYVGYVVGVSAATGAQTTMWSSEGSSSSSEAGIWQSGGGLVSDGAGRILLTTGNGVSPPPGPGSAPPANLAESVVRLAVNPADGSLTAADFFSPVNNTNLDLSDADLGSGGPMALPNGFGPTGHPNLLVQVGKDGRVFLLDRNNLGGTGQGPSGTDAALQVLGPYNGVWGHPAFWGGNGGYVYTVEKAGYLRAFQYGVTAAATPLPSLTSVGTSEATWGFTAGSPVVTSTGADSGSAVVWAVNSAAPTGSGGELDAYNAVPQEGVLQRIYAASIGTASKFTVPATDGGRVYVGTRDGNLIGFGRPTAAALAAAPTEFGAVPVGGTSPPATATITATRPVTVTDIATTSAPFAIGSNPPTFPQTLNKGDTLAVPVIFQPTAPGEASGGLRLTVSEGTATGTVTFGLDGTGTQPGLSASPKVLTFPQSPTGTKVTSSVSVTNTGTSTETITGSSGPRQASPFTASGTPPAGYQLAPQASVTFAITFAPTQVGSAQTDNVTINADAGSVTISLNGSAIAGAPHLKLLPTTLDFGKVGLGQSVTKSFLIANTGNTVLTVTKAAPPSGSFRAVQPVSVGQQLSPGDALDQSVTFTPTAPGTATGTYQITGDDSLGAQSVTLTGTGVGSPDGHWAVAADGGIFTFGGAHIYGSTAKIHLNQPIVGMAATPDGKGYWEVAADGGIFASGDARFHGSTGGMHLNQPIVGMASTPSGLGYYLVATDGGIFTFGDAHFHGSTGAKHLNQPIVGMATTPSGNGYYLVARDGGIFTFGDAHYYGSTGSVHLNQPIVGMISAGNGHGYTLIAADGGDFTFGPSAPFFGSVPGRGISVHDVVGGVLLADGGYVDLEADGTGYWWTSLGGRGTETLGRLSHPLVGGAAVPTG